MRIRVLWIDDEYTKLSPFISLAEQYDIDIVAFESSEEGLNALRQELKKFDAVILDVKGRLNAGYTSLNAKGFGWAWQQLHIIQGASGHDLPIFIFTGQPDFINDKDFKDQFGDFYQKGRDESNLLKAIVNRVSDSANYQARLKFQKVLDLANDKFIGFQSESILMEMILDVSMKLDCENTERKFNDIRKLLELMVDQIVELKIIPSAILSENGKFSKSIRLLTGGVEGGYKFKSDVLNPLISGSLNWVNAICNDGSHANDNLQLNVHSFIQKQHSPYLYYATLYQLFDILLWFGEFCFINQNQEKNIELCQKTACLYEGILEKDINGNYFCGEFSLIPRELGVRYDLGDTIQIYEFKDNLNKKTNKKYRYFAIKYEKKIIN